GKAQNSRPNRHGNCCAHYISESLAKRALGLYFPYVLCVNFAPYQEKYRSYNGSCRNSQHGSRRRKLSAYSPVYRHFGKKQTENQFSEGFEYLRNCRGHHVGKPLEISPY